MKFLDLTYVNLFYLLSIPVLLYIIGRLILKRRYVPFIYKIDKKEKRYIGVKISSILDLIADLMIILFSLFYINHLVSIYDVGKIQRIFIVDTSPSVSFPFYRLDSLKEIVFKYKKDDDVIITTDGKYNIIETSPYCFPSLSLNMAELYPVKNGVARDIVLYGDNDWYNGYTSFNHISPSFNNYIVPELNGNKIRIVGKGKLTIEIKGVVILEKYVSKDTLINIPEGDSILIRFNGDKLYVIGKTDVYFKTDGKGYAELVKKIMESMNLNIVEDKDNEFMIDKFHIVCDSSDNNDYIDVNGRELEIYKVHHTIPKGKVLLWSKSGYPLVEYVNDTILFHFSIYPQNGGFVITPYYMKLWYDILTNLLNKGKHLFFVINGKKVNMKEHPPFIFNYSNINNNSKKKNKYFYCHYYKPFLLYIITIIGVSIIKYRLF